MSKEIAPSYVRGGAHEKYRTDDEIASVTGFRPTRNGLCAIQETFVPRPARRSGASGVAENSTLDADTEGSTSAGGSAESVADSEGDASESMDEPLMIDSDGEEAEGIDPEPELIESGDELEERPLRRDLHEEARSVKHLLRHKVGIKCACGACMRGKTKRKPRRQRKNKKDPREIPTEFGDIVTCDHVLMHDWWGKPGCGGTPDCFNMLDIGTGFKHSEGVYSKNTLETYKLIQYFRGRDHIHSIYSDNWKSIKKSCLNLGIMWEPSQPGVHHSNAVIERCNQDIMYGARALMIEAGLPGCYWT